MYKSIGKWTREQVVADDVKTDVQGCHKYVEYRSTILYYGHDQANMISQDR